jgi:hypothetical protein
MTTDTVINAEQDPALANMLAQEAMAISAQEATVQAMKLDITLPPDTTVTLPGGLYNPFEGIITTAEVRELTGIDEEAISKINDPGKSLLAILERATVKIGNEPATKGLLDLLYSGDREMLLLGIRKATFGSQVKVGPGNCPDCGHEQIFELDLNKDVPIKTLEGDREFTVDCKVGAVVASLPTGSLQKAIVESTNKTSAELDTILLKQCIISINGQDLVDPEAVRRLSIQDRRAVIKAITDRNPGPQLGDMKKACQSCGSEVPIPLSLADLFRE